MECDAVYIFTSDKQFWAELEDIISLSPDSSLDQLDYALRNYVAFASNFMDEYLAEPGQLDAALFALLESPLFNSHVDRMTANIISCINSTASSATLFIALMLILHLGLSNPITSSMRLLHNNPTTTTRGSKVFKAMRRKWNEVVPALIDCVLGAGVIEKSKLTKEEKEVELARSEMVGVSRPRDGWTERAGVAAAGVLYEVCRVQRLSSVELSLFSYPFLVHIFTLIERTRDAEDESFNYTLIKLVIALNEQFMVSHLPLPAKDSFTRAHGSLPPPILPNIVKGVQSVEEETNLVLAVLKSGACETKTFGENIIFILNRSNGTPDSLCVSLLILKILYLLFTTSGTQEYFFTNDLCVLVDVFIRELCDLDEESEGLKHTYLRVLHPLLSNTQLRFHPYKRPQLRRVLASLVTKTAYREVDPTTRRLVERNLRGSWTAGLNDDSFEEGEKRIEKKGMGWSSGMGGGTAPKDEEDTSSPTTPTTPTTKRGSGNGPEPTHHARDYRGLEGLGGSKGMESTSSVNAIAEAEERRHPVINIVTASSSYRPHHHLSSSPRGASPLSPVVQSPSPSAPSPYLNPTASVPSLSLTASPTPTTTARGLSPPINRARSSSLLSPTTTSSLATSSPMVNSPSSPGSLFATLSSTPSPPDRPSSPCQPNRRRPAPPPPETGRPKTPVPTNPSPARPHTPTTQRRAAPEPPVRRNGVAEVGDALGGLSVGS